MRWGRNWVPVIKNVFSFKVLLLIAFCGLLYVTKRPTFTQYTHGLSREYAVYKDETASTAGWYVDARGPGCSSSAQRYNNQSAPLPFVVFLSPPGSGNTWTRWMIERLTGICTGSAYYDQTVVRDFPCEMDEIEAGSSIVYKSHYHEHLHSRKIIMLIRNPFKSTVAEYNRQRTSQNHTGLADDKAFYSPAWRACVRGQTQHWFNQINAAFHIADEILIVFYENLRQNLARELFRIAAFLGVHVDEERVQCTMDNSQGGHIRPKRSQRLRKIFFPHEVDNINNLIHKAYLLFLEHHVPDIPTFYHNLRRYPYNSGS